MKYVEMQVARLPITICCYQNGLILFNKMQEFFTIIEVVETGIQTIVCDMDIYISAETQIEYGNLYDYKQMPELLAWVNAQKLIMPF